MLSGSNEVDGEPVPRTWPIGRGVLEEIGGVAHSALVKDSDAVTSPEPDNVRYSFGM